MKRFGVGAWEKGGMEGSGSVGIGKDHWSYNMVWYYNFVLLRLAWRLNGVGSGSIVRQTEETNI